MQHEHRQLFWSYFPDPPNQPPVGNSPQVYLDWLNSICGLTLSWPQNHPKGQLNRSQLRALCRDKGVDVLVAYAAVMAWGGRNYHNYRISLANENRRSLITILEALRSSSKSRQEDFAAMQKAAENIKGLGISFYTKLLFFIRENPDAYILDQFTAKSARLLFDDCRVALNYSDFPDPGTSPESYDWFCEAIESLAHSRGALTSWTGEQTEQAMFDVRGGKWRTHVRKIYGKGQVKKSRTAGSRRSSIAASHTFQPVAENGTLVEGTPTSLPSLVAETHAASYTAGEELPGAAPHASDTAPIRVHCRLIDGVSWQYAFQDKCVHAQVFIPSGYIARYDALRSYLNVTDHDFGDGIKGTGHKEGKTRSLKKTVERGFNAPAHEWDQIAKEAVEAMSLLYNRISEIL